MGSRRDRSDSGFTLIELLMTMVLFGLVVALAVAPYKNYQRAQSHLASTRKIVSVLRNAQVRSVAEDSTYRVVFDKTTYRVERLVKGTWTPLTTYGHDHRTIAVSPAEFNDGVGGTSATCYFYPRGAASKGTITVVRASSGKVYTVTVEGLTARVSYS